jgi:hypothetical protein
MAGWGAFLWMRLHATTLPALFGGTTVMLCGFNIAWLYGPAMMTSIWICWLLWSLDNWWRQPTYARFLLVTLFTVLMLLGGFPFVTELGLGAGVLYASSLTVCERKPQLALRWFGILLAWIAAVAVCALPLFALQSWLSGVDTHYRSGGSFFRLSNSLLLLPSVAKHDPRAESNMYIGLAALIFAALGWSYIAWKRGRVSVLGLFSALLGIVSSVLVFEIIPANYLAWVPGLGYNAWSRSIILLDIAFAAAAVYALNCLYRSAQHVVVAQLFLSLLILAQVFDLASVFRQFNGPVSSSYFYPRTTLLTRIQRNIKPFQSAVSDGNFLVSGTLGAYGLPEWFAHAFKSESTRYLLTQVATDPFTTPTASILEARNIRLNSKVLNALGVRYAIGDDDLIHTRFSGDFGGAAPIPSRAPLPPMPQNEWIQSFNLRSNYCLTAIRLQLATYGRKGQKGRVSLRLYKGSEPSPIATSILTAGNIADNQVVSFTMPAPLELEPGNYRFSVDYSESSPGDEITAWYIPAPGKNCSLLVDGKPQVGCMYMDWLSNRTDMGGFKAIASESGIYLLENMDVPAGPYFLPHLDVWPANDSSSHITVDASQISNLSIRYSGTESGFIVLPMTINHDWLVKLNGQDVEPQRYLGSLPAIPVDGPSQLDFIYQPLYLSYGSWITLAALLGLILGGIVATAYRKRVRKTAALTLLDL